MTRTRIISIVAIIAVALAGAPVVAEKIGSKKLNNTYEDRTGNTSSDEGFRGRGFKRHGKRGRGDGMRWLKHLNLTPEQQTKIEELREETEKVTKPLRETVWDLQEQMRSKWMVDKPNEGEILSLHRKIHKIRGELGAYRIQQRIDVISILTPEQRAQMQSIKADRRRDAKHGKGRFGRGKEGKSPRGQRGFEYSD
jgi:Spy/CpxP family protein refolding chaperone